MNKFFPSFVLETSPSPSLFFCRTFVLGTRYGCECLVTRRGWLAPVYEDTGDTAGSMNQIPTDTVPILYFPIHPLSASYPRMGVKSWSHWPPAASFAWQRSKLCPFFIPKLSSYYISWLQSPEVVFNNSRHFILGAMSFGLLVQVLYRTSSSISNLVDLNDSNNTHWIFNYLCWVICLVGSMKCK